MRPLTERQLQIALMRCRDELTYDVIAERLGISMDTVKNHFYMMRKSLNVRTTATLCWHACEDARRRKMVPAMDPEFV